jgi:hypothetical protein
VIIAHIAIKSAIIIILNTHSKATRARSFLLSFTIQFAFGVVRVKSLFFEICEKKLLRGI